MIHAWHDLEPGSPAPHEFDCVIEIPLGSKVKYELDKPSGLIKLVRVLSSAVCYPANCGFIPQTLEEGGDPLGVVVLCQGPVAPPTLVHVRTAGLMTLLDSRMLEHKVVGVAAGDPEFAEYAEASEVPPYYAQLLRQFFEEYEQPGQQAVAVKKVESARAAYPVIRAALERYARKYVRQVV